jgi:hypothetical protein
LIFTSFFFDIYLDLNLNIYVHQNPLNELINKSLIIKNDFINILIFNSNFIDLNQSINIIRESFISYNSLINFFEVADDTLYINKNKFISLFYNKNVLFLPFISSLLLFLFFIILSLSVNLKKINYQNNIKLKSLLNI